jgi:uncharacterized protein (DUF2252 family)
MGRATEEGSGMVEHLSVAERVAKGKQVRAAVPRSSHATVASPSPRPSAVSILEGQAADRLTELVPIRYGRMAASPFAFYRGAAAVMASDLAAAPHSGLTVQLCGDAHVANFGGFASPDREMVFDLNDFDETLPGPFEWDVKRLAASLEIAGRQRGFAAKDRSLAVLGAVNAYRTAMHEFAAMQNLAVWYVRLDVRGMYDKWGTEADKASHRNFRKEVEHAQKKDRLKALSKLTHEVDGEIRIISNPPLLVPVEELYGDLEAGAIASMIQDGLRRYIETLPRDRQVLANSYRFTHLARKVVGVGSVGTVAWVALLLGRDDVDPLFIQVKEAKASVFEPYLGASGFENHGERVVEGQRLTQAASDIFLGWERNLSPEGIWRDFYFRQLWDWKMSTDLEAIRVEPFKVYGKMCGWTLARAHARSGDRIAIASYLGQGDLFDRAVTEYASHYADLNERDHAELDAAIESGAVKAERGI